MPLTTLDTIAIGNHVRFLNKSRDPKNQIKISKGWENFCETSKLPQALVIDIPDEEALQSISRFIYSLNVEKNSNIVMRPAAGGVKGKVFDCLSKNYSDSFSLSNIVEADVVVRLVHGTWPFGIFGRSPGRIKAWFEAASPVLANIEELVGHRFQFKDFRWSGECYVLRTEECCREVQPTAGGGHCSECRV